MEEEIKKNTPRDVFLHLLAIVTLYWSAVSFIALLWQYINYYFPDALNRYYSQVSFTGPIRFAVASLSTKGQYNWDHEAGRVCFERTIDKELYPPTSKIK